MIEKIKTYFKKQAFSLAVFIILTTLVPFILYSAFFQFAPLSFIAETHSAHAEDIHIGDITQSVTFNRSIKHIHEAFIVRELNLVNPLNQEVIYKTTVSIIDEPSDGIAVVHYDVPENIQPGEYYWSIGITRKFSYGIVRNDEFQTNVFKVYP